jgi:hypothetical protein
MIAGLPRFLVPSLPKTRHLDQNRTIGDSARSAYRKDGATSWANKRMEWRSSSYGMRPPIFGSMMMPDRPTSCRNVLSRAVTSVGVPNTTRVCNTSA